MAVKCSPKQTLKDNGFRLLCYTEPSPHCNKTLYFAVSPSNEALGAEGFEDEHLAFSVLLERFTEYYKNKGRGMRVRKEYGS